MQKIYGATARQDGLYKIGRSKWELIYGFGTDGDNNGYNWRKRFDHQPTIDEIKSAVISTINAATEEKILTGFKWDGLPVWLSTENQINYLNIARDAGVVYPLCLKLGEDAEGLPQYRTFDTAADFDKFNTAATAHVRACITAGWQEKDSVDWKLFATH